MKFSSVEQALVSWNGHLGLEHMEPKVLEALYSLEASFDIFAGQKALSNRHELFRSLKSERSKIVA